MIKFKAVSHRLIFWILAASASLFLLISYYQYSIAERFLHQQIRSKASLVKMDMVTRVGNLLYVVSDSVKTAAVILPSVGANHKSITTLLKNLVEQKQDIYGMAIALEPGWLPDAEQGFAPYFYHDKDGLAYTDLSKEDYDYRNQPWYRQAVESGRAVWSEPYNDTGGGNIAMVTYSAPIYTDNKKRELIGVITADIALSSFAELVSRLALGEKGSTYIFTRQGNIITHSNTSRVMDNIFNNPAGTANARQYRTIINGMQNGETDSLHMDCPSSEDRQCWLSYQPVAGTDWSIAVLIPMDELAGSQLEYRYFSLVITIIGLILLTLIVVMLSRRLTRPLLALTESTRALARGELDRPIDDFQLDDEIGALARQYQLMQASLKNYIEQLNLQTARRERLEGELSAAHDIQMQMLPDQGRSNTLMPGWQLSAVLEPAKSVGGDFYHYQLLDEKRLFIAIGDVSDKGVAAALFMAKTQTLLRQLCCTDDDLGLLLSRINQQLCIDNSSCMFVTLLVGVLDIESGALDLASAGHPPPLVGNPQCGFIDMETGPALGFFADASFTSHHSTLARHSPLVLTTDGVDEASNSQLQHYGEQRLQNIIRSMHGSDSKELLQKILADIVDFRASAEPSDDLTIMILMRR